ncbi:MAG: polyphosphate kinase 2 family protein [Geminicoccaceae bacterium]
MDYRKKLVVEPGSRVKLAKVDPAFTGKHTDQKEASEAIQKQLDRLTKLQYLLYADRGQSVLVVLQGIDAAGKDGVCWHVMRAMNPQGCRVVGFKQPTPEELAHDYLWRIHKQTPAKGEVAVFNRSHYEDVLVVRVHKLVPKSVWKARYDQINEFEARLADAGTRIVKFFLYISKEEQLRRFADRLQDPARHWKISDSDYKERDLWDDYTAAYEDMLEKCSTKHAPWYLIPSNHKWFRNLATSQILVSTLEDMGLKLPPTTVDIAAITQAYQKALGAERQKDPKAGAKPPAT